jgi:RNase P subunit RPR2
MPKRANQSEVIFYLYEILKNEGEIIGEINLLGKLKEKGIRITPSRLRKIIYDIPQIKVNVQFSKKWRIIKKKCPICGSKLFPYKGMTLEGKKRVIGYRCKKCNFDSLKDGKPLIYSFKLMNHDI